MTIKPVYEIATTPRKVVFSTPLEEHLRCTGRNVSLVIELCVHVLYSNALHEEGLFRIPGSSVKIKKLKNAINAWFVTLASQTELENDQQQQLVENQSPSLLAIYALFKDIVGQKKPSQTTSNADNNNAVTTTPSRDDSTLTHTNLQSNILSSSSQEPHQYQEQQQPIVFDVHTIAGLLKLYLRELSEPLFTYALYDQWINATVKTLDQKNQTTTQVNSSEPLTHVSSSTLTALGKVVEQLPKANYDNLKLLIRFLHTLTRHREFNRMTSTNLAITMAPSLIWSRPTPAVTSTQPSCNLDDHTLGSVGGELGQVDEMHALNMQMSSIGISASLHALVIENLINHAEVLFPGQMSFTLPGLDEQVPTTSKVMRVGDDQKVILSKGNRSKQDRCMKSTSPTGLSTASSSSFSSTASVTSSSAPGTANLSNKINHSRKGGSMDGLLKDTNNTNISPFNLDNNCTYSRPKSVHINQQHEHSSIQQIQLQQQPPPVPPAPAARSHSRQASESSVCSANRLSSSHKQQAPAPPSYTLKRQPKITPHSDLVSDYRAKVPNKQNSSATGTSLRGTGVIVAQPAARPNVPPPNRPAMSKDRTTSSVDTVDSDTQQSESISSIKPASKCASDNENNPILGDNKNSNNVVGTVNLRADFEEINTAEVDDIDSSDPISPIISLESISGGDSSFDDECSSLEHSWTECELEQDGRSPVKMAGENSESKVTKVPDHDEDSRSESLRTQTIKPTPRLQRKKNNLMTDSNKENGIADVNLVAGPGDDEESNNDDDDDGEDTLTAAPTKPPRITSPKVTQSTPL